MPNRPLSPYRFPNSSHRNHNPVTVPEGHDRAAKRLLGDLLWTAELKGGVVS